MNEVFFMEYQSNAKANTIEGRKTGSVLTGRNNKLVKHKLVTKIIQVYLLARWKNTSLMYKKIYENVNIVIIITKSITWDKIT